MKIKVSAIETVVPVAKSEDMNSITVGGTTYLTDMSMEQIHERTGKSLMLVPAGTEEEHLALVNPFKIVCVMPSDTKFTSVNTAGGHWVDVIDAEHGFEARLARFLAAPCTPPTWLEIADV